MIAFVLGIAFGLFAMTLYVLLRSSLPSKHDKYSQRKP